MKTQETLEEAAEKESEYLADWEDKEMYKRGFKDGAKWQQEQDNNKYSEDDLKYAFDSGRVRLTFGKERPFVFKKYEDFIKQFKNK